MTKPWRLKNGIWYSRGERFPLFDLDGRIWYVSLNRYGCDVRGGKRREDLLPYKVEKRPIFCLNRVDFWRLDPERTSAGEATQTPRNGMVRMFMRDVRRSLPWVPEVFSRVRRGAFGGCRVGRRPKKRAANPREKTLFARVTYKTWPKPETAHEKPLEPRVVVHWWVMKVCIPVLSAVVGNSITTKRIMRLVLEVNIPTFFFYNSTYW